MTNIVTDKMSFTDTNNVKLPSQNYSGFWAKTKIMGSYDDILYDKNGIPFFGRKIPSGISELGETIFKTEKSKPIFTKKNMVPIGGCQYVMERIFEVSGDQFEVPTMYTSNGIGLPDSLPPTEKYKNPNGVNEEKTIHYRYGHFVQLFGIGITGTAENDVTVHPVDYRENNIELNKPTTDGLTLTGTMIPFRYTSETLSQLDRKKYFGKKVFSSGETGYYLKMFEAEPKIKHIWKTGDDIEDETLVSSEDVWQPNVGMNAVESFTDIILKISKNDVKEWFINLEQEERSRINTIALFTGRYIPSSDIQGSTSDFGDFQDVRLFSKLNIPTEYLSLNKDLNIIYRVYTS